MTKTLITAILMIVCCATQGQVDATTVGVEAATMRLEVDDLIEQAMKDTKWSKAQLKRNGRRLVLKGMNENVTVKRVVRTRSNGTLDRLTLKPFTSGPKTLQATFVDDHLVHAQWVAVEKDGAIVRTVQKTFVQGRLIVLPVEK
jgi:hypothetical protein